MSAAASRGSLIDEEDAALAAAIEQLIGRKKRRVGHDMHRIEELRAVQVLLGQKPEDEAPAAAAVVVRRIPIRHEVRPAQTATASSSSAGRSIPPPLVSDDDEDAPAPQAEAMIACGTCGNEFPSQEFDNLRVRLADRDDPIRRNKNCRECNRRIAESFAARQAARLAAAVEDEEDDDDDDIIDLTNEGRQTCHGVRQDGDACGNPPLRGGDYCRWHANH